MPYERTQKLNAWARMLHEIYGNTQNYAKTAFELHSHLTEVTGACGKLLVKKGDAEAALEFLPKMFGWAVALFLKVTGSAGDLEQALLIKYPRACSYCLGNPCECWSREKSEIDDVRVRDLRYREAPKQDRSLNGFQMMFRSVYGASWGLDGDIPGTPADHIRTIYTRMVEELAETAEAIRFHHLYPSNFNNEFSDYLAWWFALVTNMHRLIPDRIEPILAEDIVWPAYPGFCVSCGLIPCDCRPGPVRELLSKPSLNDLAYIDALTQAENRAGYDRALAEIGIGNRPAALPIACVRVDLDDFKLVNDEISHDAGDVALRHVVTSIRRKVRPRDKVFRVGGDEFAILCQDLSGLEAEGMMARVASAVREKPIRGARPDGTERERVITLSIGITECGRVEDLKDAFTRADHAAIRSKEAGKDRITRSV
jgi:diguanylate cyclase (GGDEF)-like protein